MGLCFRFFVFIFCERRESVSMSLRTGHLWGWQVFCAGVGDLQLTRPGRPFCVRADSGGFRALWGRVDRLADGTPFAAARKKSL